MKPNGDCALTKILNPFLEAGRDVQQRHHDLLVPTKAQADELVILRDYHGGTFAEIEREVWLIRAQVLYRKSSS